MLEACTLFLRPLMLLGGRSLMLPSISMETKLEPRESGSRWVGDSEGDDAIFWAVVSMTLSLASAQYTRGYDKACLARRTCRWRFGVRRTDR